MNKAELVDVIAEATGGTKKTAEDALNAITGSIVDALSNGDEVTIAGFGKFHVTKRKARDGRNPRTNETIKIPAADVPKFRPAKALKDALN